jgi:hypothetical protein
MPPPTGAVDAGAGAADAKADAAGAAGGGKAPAVPALAPSTVGKAGAGVLSGRLLRLMPIKLVCLNLNRRDTWQQPDPASASGTRY